jgi:hypothetical protein
MSQARRLDEYDSYEYLCPDGNTVLKLRCMSDRERRGCLSGRVPVLNSWVEHLDQYVRKLADAGESEPPSYSEYEGKYNKLRDELAPLVELIGDKDAIAEFKLWDGPGYLTHVIGLYYRIIYAESQLALGQEVPAINSWPTPDEIAGMSRKEAETLGEGLPPSASPTTTPSSDVPAATSSSGRGSTRAAKSKTSATSRG